MLITEAFASAAFHRGERDTVKNEVFVIATLYRRHATTPVYDLAALKKIITAVNPEVLVLDVNPKELKEEKVYPGKIEYTEVIFPFLKAHPRKAYAGEPAEPMFSEIVEATIRVHKDFETQKPEAFQTFEKFEAASFEALKVSWAAPADVNSRVTDQVLAGKVTLQDRLLGPVSTEGWERWNKHIADMVLKAAKENPGKRILVLVGIDNCYTVRERLRHSADITLIDTEYWLRKHHF
jgi:hypothetical protein